MRILVCRGREFTDAEALNALLDSIHHGDRGPI